MERIVKGIWIPIEIWEAEDLSWNEKFVLMEIDSYTQKGKECYISNRYIADRLGVSERTAREYLSHLIDAGYVKLVKFDGRTRYVESALPSLPGRVEENFQAEWKSASRQSGNKVPHTDSIEDLKKGTDIYTPKPPKFNFRQGIIDAGVSPDTADQWLEVRKLKRLASTEIALKDTLREIARSGRSAEACIHAAVVRSWGGFKAEWLEREEKGDRHARPKDGDAMMKMYEALKSQRRYNPEDDLPDTPDEQ